MASTRPAKHKPGLAACWGWPLDSKTGGGRFYHLTNENHDALVAVGFVIHLNYENHGCRRSMSSSVSSCIRTSPLFEGGKRLALWSSRAINEGRVAERAEAVVRGRCPDRL